MKQVGQTNHFPPAILNIKILKKLKLRYIKKNYIDSWLNELKLELKNAKY